MQEGPVSPEIINRVGGSRDTCCCNLICTRRDGTTPVRKQPLQPFEAMQEQDPQARTKFLCFSTRMKLC